LIYREGRKKSVARYKDPVQVVGADLVRVTQAVTSGHIL